MNCTQNYKIDQVTEQTLVVGIDIAKRTHYACFVDDRGRVLRKSFPIFQSKEGFQQLYEAIQEAMQAFVFSAKKKYRVSQRKVQRITT